METMTHSPLNVDLKKMDYETFKTFMRELAQMYSDVKDDAYLLFFRNLEQLAKVVSTLPRNPLVFYGAYEIADNQVVVPSLKYNLPMKSMKQRTADRIKCSISSVVLLKIKPIYIARPKLENISHNLNTSLFANKPILQ